jgi:hypothetical protein
VAAGGAAVGLPDTKGNRHAHHALPRMRALIPTPCSSAALGLSLCTACRRHSGHYAVRRGERLDAAALRLLNGDQQPSRS